MPDRPELPEQFRSTGGVLDVFPDERPMRWTIWDRDGCVGEISWSEGAWHAHPEPRDAEDDGIESIHRRWQDAIDAVASA